MGAGLEEGASLPTQLTAATVGKAAEAASRKQDEGRWGRTLARLAVAAVAGGGSSGGRGGIMKEEDGSSDDGPDRFGDHVSSSCASGLEDTQKKKTVESHISLNRDRARNFNLSEGGQLRKKNIHMLLKMLGVHFRST